MKTENARTSYHSFPSLFPLTSVALYEVYNSAPKIIVQLVGLVFQHQNKVFLSFAKSKTWLSSVLSVTYRPAVYHNEGLCFWIKVALLDGFRPPRYYVTHVIIRGVCGAQGELGHDVGEVGEPFSGIQQLINGDCGVCCYNTHKQAVLDCYDMTEKRVSVDR